MRLNSPIPLTFHNPIVDNIAQNHVKKICYVGFRPINTLKLHECFLKRRDDTKGKPNLLQFDASFESGNLDLAVHIQDHEYDLFLRVDSNTKGHTCWYYFTVMNMKPGVKYKFNICNLCKKKSLYQRGMKPYIKAGSTWRQGGENITYVRKPLRLDVSQRDFYCLSFEYLVHSESQVTFAYCIPYTYSKMLQFIK